MGTAWVFLQKEFSTASEREEQEKRKEADRSLIVYVALKEFFPLSMNLQLQHVAEEMFQPFSLSYLPVSHSQGLGGPIPSCDSSAWQ